MTHIKDIKKMKKLDDMLVQKISTCTNIPVEEIRQKSLSYLEKEAKIKVKTPKIYFDWELGEKSGWQTQPYAFISERVYEKREKRLAKILEVK